MPIKSKPKISVVVPAYNEEDYLPACLAALKKQKFNGSYEIIVVDNNSFDKTAQIARDFDCKVVFEPRKGVGSARQAGFAVSSGEIIVSTDADTIVPQDWLSRIAIEFKKDKNLAAFGGLYVLSSGSIFTRLIVFLFVYPVHFLDRFYNGGWNLPGANFAVRKTCFSKTGGFNVNLKINEEFDLSQRIRKFGKVKLSPCFLVKTSGRGYEYGIISWFIRYGPITFSRILLKRYNFQKLKSIRKEISHKRVLLEQIILGFLIFCFSVYFLFFSANSQVFGKVISHENTKQKIIALTFDDGPNEPYTSEILDILDKYNIKATFFEVGENIERYPTTTERIFQEGHVIGNHSYSHSFKKNFSHPFFKDEIEKTQDIIFGVTGKKPALFRPPWFFRDPLIMKTAKKYGLVIITGKFASNAEGAQHRSELNIDEISEQVKPGRILIFHDGYNNKRADRSQTVKAIEVLAPQLIKDGFTFVTIPELLDIQPYQ